MSSHTSKKKLRLQKCSVGDDYDYEDAPIHKWKKCSRCKVVFDAWEYNFTYKNLCLSCDIYVEDVVVVYRMALFDYDTIEEMIQYAKK